MITLGYGDVDLGNPVSDDPLNEGLAAWWLGLPGNSGTSRLFDATGRGNTATVEGTWTGGVGGFSEVRASGGSGVILSLPYIGAVMGVTYGDAWILSWWFEPFAYGGPYVPIIDTADRKPASFYDTNGNHSFSGSFGALPVGGRYRLAIVVPSTGTASSSSGSRFYRDGVYVSTYPVEDAFWSTTYTVSLGGDLSGGTGTVTAKYGDIRFRRLATGQPTTVYDAAVAADCEQALRGHPDTLRRLGSVLYSFPPPSPPASTTTYKTKGYGDVDLGNPVADHELNEGLLEWWLPLPGNSGGLLLHGLKGRSNGTLNSALGDGALQWGATGGYPGLSNWGNGRAVTITGPYPGLVPARTTHSGAAAVFLTDATSRQFIIGAPGHAPSLYADFGTWKVDDPWRGASAVTVTTGLTVVGYTIDLRTPGTNRMSLYVNGVEVASTTTTEYAWSTDSTPWVFGAANLTGSFDWPLRGSLLAVALTQPEIAWGEVEHRAFADQFLRGHPDTLNRLGSILYSTPSSATLARKLQYRKVGDPVWLDIS